LCHAEFLIGVQISQKRTLSNRTFCSSCKRESVREHTHVAGLWISQPPTLQTVDLILTRSVSEGLLLTRQQLSLTHVSGRESPFNQESAGSGR